MLMENSLQSHVRNREAVLAIADKAERNVIEGFSELFAGHIRNDKFGTTQSWKRLLSLTSRCTAIIEP